MHAGDKVARHACSRKLRGDTSSKSTRTGACRPVADGLHISSCVPAGKHARTHARTHRERPTGCRRWRRCWKSWGRAQRTAPVYEVRDRGIRIAWVSPAGARGRQSRRARALSPACTQEGGRSRSRQARHGAQKARMQGFSYHAADPSHLHGAQATEGDSPAAGGVGARGGVRALRTAWSAVIAGGPAVPCPRPMATPNPNTHQTKKVMATSSRRALRRMWEHEQAAIRGARGPGRGKGRASGDWRSL